jgi:gamma-glutamylcyclotransferase
MLYFAYGSNMCLPRMNAEVPRAHFFDVGEILGYKIEFHAISHKDGSAKISIIPTEDPEEVVYGVIYEIDPRDKHILDREEGLGAGFREVSIKILRPLGDIFVFTYETNTDNMNSDLKPFSWYKDLIIAGAIQQGLPSDYVDMFRRVPAIEDPDVYRTLIHRRFLQGGVR